MQCFFVWRHSFISDGIMQWLHASCSRAFVVRWRRFGNQFGGGGGYWCCGAGLISSHEYVSCYRSPSGCLIIHRWLVLNFLGYYSLSAIISSFWFSLGNSVYSYIYIFPVPFHKWVIWVSLYEFVCHVVGAWRSVLVAVSPVFENACESISLFLLSVWRVLCWCVRFGILKVIPVQLWSGKFFPWCNGNILSLDSFMYMKFFWVYGSFGLWVVRNLIGCRSIL